MSEIFVHTRSFHPDKNFGVGGLGFEGDNRKFSVAIDDLTSRIYHYIPINLQIGKAGQPVCDSDHSQNAIAHHAVNAAVDAAETVSRSPVRLPDAPPMQNDYAQPERSESWASVYGRYQLTATRIDLN
ncbi:hypothetical protein H4P12_13765 [Paracoccus sp. 11-3]|uniref:Uncharacterized protein n=1 Tax=Paracoccus amoyensis TaxID=2760093 RepID=A0A926GI45_9RHOB|nr:hypothetical protein [Paracoccus amoyensis]MBC9247744.1 hypothetical protein [Paracoccus amoyensis]